MSIQSEITRISGNVSDAMTAIANKGVTVPQGSNSDDLATLIAQISGGGGGGGEYAWLGNSAEKVGTVVNKTINLKNDTTYDSWTASTSSTTIKEASSSNDYSFTAVLGDYDYCLVTRAFVQPVYLAGTTLKYTIFRTAQYYLYYVYGYGTSTVIGDHQADKTSAYSYFSLGSGMQLEYYYNNVGSLLSRAVQEGPIYCSGNPTYGITMSGYNATVTYKMPALNAKCNANRFSTSNKTNVDSAATNMSYTVDLYRVPRGNGIASKWVRAMLADLNAS